MEGVAVSRQIGFALAFEDRPQRENLAAARAVRGEAGRSLFERFTDDDRLGQRGERDARDESARLREYFDQALIGELEDRFANGRAADAIGGGDLAFKNRLARQAFERQELSAQVGVDRRRLRGLNEGRRPRACAGRTDAARRVAFR